MRYRAWLGSDIQQDSSLLVRYAARPNEELDELLRQMVVNLVIGNVDAHAKNYSLLYRQLGVPELSPLYDVVPVLDIEPRAEYLSMRVGGKIRASEVGREDVLREVALWGIGNEHGNAVIDQTLDGLGEGLKAASMLYPAAAARHEGGARARLALMRG